MSAAELEPEGMATVMLWPYQADALLSAPLFTLALHLLDMHSCRLPSPVISWPYLALVLHLLMARLLFQPQW